MGEVDHVSLTCKLKQDIILNNRLILATAEKKETDCMGMTSISAMLAQEFSSMIS
jgi:hypothetical protein